MIDQIWPLATAVMAANFATIMLIYGLRQITKSDRSEEEPRIVALLSIIVPMAFFGGGVYLYW